MCGFCNFGFLALALGKQTTEHETDLFNTSDGWSFLLPSHGEQNFGQSNRLGRLALAIPDRFCGRHDQRDDHELQRRLFFESAKREIYLGLSLRGFQNGKKRGGFGNWQSDSEYRDGRGGDATERDFH